MNSIQKLSELIVIIKKMLIFFRTQDFYHGYGYLSGVIERLSVILSEPTTIFSLENTNQILSCIEALINAQENNDTVLIADLAEVQLLPLINDALQRMILQDNTLPHDDYLQKNLACLKDQSLASAIQNHVDIVMHSDSYCVEVTSLGTNTVKYSDERRTFYYHSNVDPIKEGDLLTSYYSEPDTFDYTFYGFGFGYHILSMLRFDRRFHITALETNLDILTLAFIYCDLEEILTNPHFSLIYCDMADIYTYMNQSSSLFLLHSPSLNALPEGKEKKALNDYFIRISSVYAQRKKLAWNYYSNMKLGDCTTECIKDSFKDKDIFFIGGGPSLEYHMEYLHKKRQEENNVLICASTVYKRLLSSNIIPNFVIMCDPQEDMERHIKDAPETTAQLIYISTTSTNAVQAFQGKRYIGFQKGYLDAEAYASEHNIELLESGGTVSSFAVDLAIKYHCRSLTTLGLDLAYTENKRHSHETESNFDSSQLPKVKSVSGDWIATANNYNIYREWIERRIENISEITFTNLSHGAYIKGMENRLNP